MNQNQSLDQKRAFRNKSSFSECEEEKHFVGRSQEFKELNWSRQLEFKNPLD